MQIRGLGNFTDPARHPSLAGPRHREMPLYPGAAEHAGRCRASARSGWGETAPGRGERSRASAPLPSRLRKGCSASAGTAGDEKTADLRPGEPGECYLLPGKLFAPGKLRAPGKCLTASHGAGPCCCPPRYQRPPPPRSLAAPPGTTGALSLSQPSLNRAIGWGFFL